MIGLNDFSTRVSGGDLVIVDGSNQLVIVNPTEARVFARPKSASTMRPPGSTITLEGFTSRWTMPAR